MGEDDIRNWDIKTGRVIRVVHFSGTDETVEKVSDDGEMLVTLRSNSVEIRELPGRRLVRHVSVPDSKGLELLAVSPKRDLILLTQTNKDISETLIALQVESGRIEKWTNVPAPDKFAVFSADGRRIAIRFISKERQQRIGCIDRSSGRLFGSFVRSEQSIALSPDGSFIVGWDYDGTLFAVDAITGETRQDVKYPKDLADSDDSLPWFRSLAFSRDGKWFAVSDQRRLRLWDLKEGRAIREWPHPAICMAFDSDGKKLVTCNDLVRVYDVGDGMNLMPEFGPVFFPKHRGQTAHFITPASGKRLATCNCADGYAQSWDWTTGTPGFRLPLATEGRVDVCLSGSGALLVALVDEELQVWDIASGKELRHFSVLPQGLPNDEWQVRAARSVSDTGPISVLLAHERSELKHLGLGGFADVMRELGPPQLVFWDVKTGKMLDRRAVLSPKDGRVRVDPDLRQLVQQQRLIDDRINDARVPTNPSYDFGPSIAFSPDGRLTARTTKRPEVRDQQEEIVVLETATMKPLFRHLIKADEDCGAFAISSNNRWLAFVRLWDGQKEIELWDLAEQKQVKYPGRAEGVQELTFLTANRLLAAYDDTTALLWELPKGADRPSSQRITDRTWTELADPEAKTGQSAVWALVNEPVKAIALLRRELQPVPPVAEAKLAPLLIDLGSDLFATRDSASRRLLEYGQVIESVLEAALKKSTSAEQRQRLTKLLEECRSSPLTADERRAVRAVQAAEQIGSPDAKALLQEWAKGAESVVLTREAKAALERVQ